MSGHSKWHNIQNKKGKADAKRGKVFTKLGKEIVIAVKNGGPVPDTNPKLRDVIVKAKAANMPNDTITRSIKKASGELASVNYEKIVYEGYGPSGVAVIVETLTDNKNRSAGNVRSAFTKGGGNMGATGCVSFMFQEKGEIVIEREDKDEDEVMMLALDAGAEDFAAEEEVFIVTT
ncbi:YebC/PmpR family DNA-binding transcriptional regulator, partial [Clostridium perfringens]|nr:YebC/PmpR family DNA-binding transcriptional regulator [Clostridium perfringens]